ncbi:MAG: spore maturation protein [Clostridia bacterium]|nr:spore maturation protein [Clostridia bacterium]
MKVLEFISYLMIPLMILGIIIYGLVKKEKVYELFLEGVTDGFKVMLQIFPSLLSIMIAIDLFKISGGMNLLTNLITPISKIFGIPNEIMPIGIMRSISGGASVGLLADTLNTYGADSLIGRIASTVMGSSETTLYVLAVYLAATSVKDTRNILAISLISDFVAIILAVVLCKII